MLKQNLSEIGKIAKVSFPISNIFIKNLKKASSWALGQITAELPQTTINGHFPFLGCLNWIFALVNYFCIFLYIKVMRISLLTSNQECFYILCYFENPISFHSRLYLHVCVFKYWAKYCIIFFWNAGVAKIRLTLSFWLVLHRLDCLLHS